MTRRSLNPAMVQGEEQIIAALAPLAQGTPGAFGLKDDCALLTPAPGHDLVFKTDPIAQDVHFLSITAARDVAWKALAVNISDLAAKGAVPVGYLLALSFPQAPDVGWITDFARGLQEAQAAFGCVLLGGDTDRRPGPLTVSVTVIGSVPRGVYVPRTGAQPGDLLFVSGTIGDASLGLALVKDPALQTAWGLSDHDAAYLRARYDRPQPRLALRATLRQCASAAMDISDGLVRDLGRMLSASGTLGGHLRASAVPLSPAARAVAMAEPGRLARLVTAGDDYEVLVAVPPAQAAQFQTAAASAGVPVTAVGEVSFGPGQLTVTGPDGNPLRLPERHGWDHF